MNPLSKMQNRHPAKRSGISLFEVLISILVASIGVTGVLVLIPFAVKNAQKGIDRESAVNAAKNFYADFQAYGYHDPDTWFDNDPLPHHASIPNPLNPPANNIINGWPYVFDPLGVTDKMFDPTLPAPDGSQDFENFCDNNTLVYISGTPPTGLPLLNIITIDGFLTGANNEAIARSHKAFTNRLCLPQNLLIFDAPGDELNPPVQRYLTLDSQPNIKRQYRARYGVVAFLVPTSNAPYPSSGPPSDGVYPPLASYKMYTVVLSVGDRSAIRVFELPQPTVAKDSLNPRGYKGIALGGGDVNLAELTVQPPEGVSIRNNDWVMLINHYDDGGGAVFDDVQLDFYRVLHSVQETEIDPTGGDPLIFDATITGPDFDLFPDWNDASDGDLTTVTTYAVLIPNVLAVYERTFRTEPVSTWAEP